MTPSIIRNLWSSLRPQQWLKNLFVFSAVIFTGRLFEPLQVLKSLAVFLLFCLLSGAGYLINDVIDRRSDQFHPHKRQRPVADGRLRSSVAVITALVLMVVGLGASVFIGRAVGYTLGGYTALTLAYSAWLKQFMIVDIIVVALGYVLRVLAGGFAIGVISTPWSLACTFFLAACISVGKRLSERRALEQPGNHRAVLDQYPQALLNRLLLITAAFTIMAYILFTFASGKDVKLIITIPFVLYGVLRYIRLVKTA